MSKSIITSIFIEPSLLNNNLKKSLTEYVNKKFTGTCSKKHGYIKEVIRINKIIDTKISNIDSNIFFTLDIEIKNLYPVIGQIHDAIVCMVFEKGIFSLIDDKMKILIPLDKLSDYTYENNSYRKDDVIIRFKKKIKVKIYDFQYSNKEYNCLGEIEP